MKSLPLLLQNPRAIRQSPAQNRPADDIHRSTSAMAIAVEGEYQRIMEEYRTWKMKMPHLYDLVISRALECPSLTVQWLPDREETSFGEYSTQKLILGTQSLGRTPNCLLLVEVLLFHKDVEVTLRNYRHEGGEIGEVGDVASKAKLVQKISHHGGIVRARYMPQNYSIVGTRTVSGEVFVFDCSKHPSNPPPDGAFNPDLRLKGKGKNFEGLGLSWSPIKEGHLLASANDHQICLWDTQATPENKLLDPVHAFKAHADVVEDVAWHLRHDYMFGSVGDDYALHIWDLRALLASKPIHSVVAHDHEVNCLAFNPFNEWILATGSGDETVKLFDIRKINAAVYTIQTNEAEVFQVGWSPKNESILASSCIGRRLWIWDVSRIGDEQTSEEARDHPPELLFIHGGHTERIFDFSWNPCDDWAIASVSTNNIIQIWKMAKHIYNGDDDASPDDPTTNATISSC